MKKLIDHYAEDQKTDDDPTAAPIADCLNPVLKRWWWKVPSNEDIKKTLDKCERPENCDAVRKVWVNEEDFKKMDLSGRNNDKPWRLINHTITRSAQPLVSAWAEIIRVESVVKDDKSSPDSSDPEVILTLPDGSSLNVSQI